jgi:Xaa-Pro aminopeptidase
MSGVKPGKDMLQREFGSPSNRLARRLRDTLSMSRVRKDPVELSLMKSAVDITTDVFRQWMTMVMAGKTDAEICAFIDAAIASHGVPRAYPTIALVGQNAARLHGFNPPPVVASADDTVLVDAAAEFQRYKSDVTRVVPVGRRFTGAQRDLYEVVLSAQKRAIEGAVPGVRYRELHKAMIVDIAEGLADMGIINGAAEDRALDGSVERLLTLHSLGHVIGIHTHDIGRFVEPGLTVTKNEPGARRCSSDFVIQPGYAFTIEPGAYLAPWLLTADVREEFAEALNWTMIDCLLEYGSAGYAVRIEDDVVAVEDGPPIVLSEAIPKEVADVEALRARS